MHNPERGPTTDLDPATRALVRLAASLTGTERDRTEAMDAAAAAAPDRAEEVLLQSYLFLGYPTTLNALSLWRHRTERSAPDRTDEDPSEWAARGETVCRRVYGRQYDALREVMGGIHPDLDVWAVREGYGKVLGRPGLDLRTRELCIVAMLCGIDAVPQLHAHLRGCLNVGVGPSAVEETLRIIQPLLARDRAEAARRVWDRVRERWSSKGEGRDVRR